MLVVLRDEIGAGRSCEIETGLGGTDDGILWGTGGLEGGLLFWSAGETGARMTRRTDFNGALQMWQLAAVSELLSPHCEHRINLQTDLVIYSSERVFAYGTSISERYIG